MFFLQRPRVDQLRTLWDQAQNASLSSAEVGATAVGDLPVGYRHESRSAGLGSGADTFDQAVAALRTWGMHTQSGLRIFPGGHEFAANLTVLVITRFGVMTIVAPCRVVYVVDEARRYGFAYGTLTGHPEQGEETFIVERGDDEVVRFQLSAFSRLREPLARLGGPIARRVQERATDAYVSEMKELTGGIPELPLGRIGSRFQNRHQPHIASHRICEQFDIRSSRSKLGDQKSP